MIDRVTDAIGRLGPVGDADGDGRQHPRPSGTATAAQWPSAARAHALQFSWDSSMEALFGRRLSGGVRAPRERRLGAAPPRAALAA